MAPLCSVAFGEEGALEELGGAEALSGIPVAHAGTEIISLDAQHWPSVQRQSESHQTPNMAYLQLKKCLS